MCDWTCRRPEQPSALSRKADSTEGFINTVIGCLLCVGPMCLGLRVELHGLHVELGVGGTLRTCSLPPPLCGLNTGRRAYSANIFTCHTILLVPGNKAFLTKWCFEQKRMCVAPEATAEMKRVPWACQRCEHITCPISSTVL